MTLTQSPDIEACRAYAKQGFNRVPIFRTLLADTETPLSAYNKLARGPNSFLFESVQGGERWGRYSIIGLPASHWLAVNGFTVDIYEDGERVQSFEVEDPLAFVEEYRAKFKSAPLPGLPVFFGGFVGYFGYDSVRYVEPRLQQDSLEDELGVPDILLCLAEEVLIFDNLAGTLTLVVNANLEVPDSFERAQHRLDELTTSLNRAVAPLDHLSLTLPDSVPLEEHAQFSTTREQFEAAVARIREYILAGDVMQVVLSHRLSIPFAHDPLSLYRALRNLNPSPYLYFLDFNDFQVVGSSPEILVRFEEQEVTVRPIAGTRPRGKTPDEDRGLEADLLADQKEIAEHLMLIDLGRNDIGKICAPGSVELTEKMLVERYSHVMHIVSNVAGRARDDVGPIDALRATLPAGTLSGAPKLRAMEIIDELESLKRGVYGGAVGYISWDGEMDTAIAIRTGVIKEGRLFVQAGAGVVADSVPAAEWQETMQKASAVLKAALLCE